MSNTNSQWNRLAMAAVVLIVVAIVVIILSN